MLRPENEILFGSIVLGITQSTLAGIGDFQGYTLKHFGGLGHCNRDGTKAMFCSLPPALSPQLWVFFFDGNKEEFYSFSREFGSQIIFELAKG